MGCRPRSSVAAEVVVADEVAVADAAVVVVVVVDLHSHRAD